MSNVLFFLSEGRYLGNCANLGGNFRLRSYDDPEVVVDVKEGESGPFTG